MEGNEKVERKFGV